jgi:hypothetical protein
MRREVAVDLPPLRNSPRVSAGSATLNVVTGNNDVNDNNDASVYIPVRTVGQRHGPRTVRRPRSAIKLRSLETARAGVAADDPCVFVTSGPRTDKKVMWESPL